MKYWNFFKANAPLILLSLLLVKSAIQPSNAEIAGIVCLSLLTAFFRFQDDNKEEPANADIKKDIETLRKDFSESRDKIDKLFIQQTLKR